MEGKFGITLIGVLQLPVCNLNSKITFLNANYCTKITIVGFLPFKNLDFDQFESSQELTVITTTYRSHIHATRSMVYHNFRINQNKITFTHFQCINSR